MSRCFGSEGVCNYHIRLGAIKIQIQVQYLPNMESVHLLEMVIAIYIHGYPHPCPRVNLYLMARKLHPPSAAHVFLFYGIWVLLWLEYSINFHIKYSNKDFHVENRIIAYENIT